MVRARQRPGARQQGHGQSVRWLWSQALWKTFRATWLLHSLPTKRKDIKIKPQTPHIMVFVTMLVRQPADTMTQLRKCSSGKDLSLFKKNSLLP